MGVDFQGQFHHKFSSPKKSGNYKKAFIFHILKVKVTGSRRKIKV
jgi:hypothetical protein